MPSYHYTIYPLRAGGATTSALNTFMIIWLRQAPPWLLAREKTSRIFWLVFSVCDLFAIFNNQQK